MENCPILERLGKADNGLTHSLYVWVVMTLPTICLINTTIAFFYLLKVQAKR